MQISVIYVLIIIWEKLTFIYYCTGNKDEIFIYIIIHFIQETVF